MTKRLLVLLNYRVSEILKKGEYPDGYYNPGDFFDEIHILMTVPDEVSAEEMQFTGGRARVFVQSIPAPGFKESLGWQLPLLQSWVNRCIDLVRQINPGIVRVHNSFIQGYLAAEIKKRLGIPYIMSLHGAFDRDDLGTPLLRFMRLFREKLEKNSIANADAVIAVYKPIIRYAKKYGAHNIHLIYNPVAGEHIQAKREYALSRPPRLVTINRQLPEKNPENIIRAVANIDCTYDIYGDGILHEPLKELAASLGAGEKIRFIKHISNEELTAKLHTYDLLVSHCDYWGISKSMIEGALAGLPIVINHHPIEPLPDFEGGWVRLCDNTPDGYRQAIQNLLDDSQDRQTLGETAYRHAMDNFDPPAMIAKVVDLYRSLIIERE